MSTVYSKFFLPQLNQALKNHDTNGYSPSDSLICRDYAARKAMEKMFKEELGKGNDVAVFNDEIFVTSYYPVTVGYEWCAETSSYVKKKSKKKVKRGRKSKKDSFENSEYDDVYGNIDYNGEEVSYKLEEEKEDFFLQDDVLEDV